LDFTFLIKGKVDNWNDVIMKWIKDLKLAKKGEKMILTEGVSPEQEGGTDSLRIITMI